MLSVSTWASSIFIGAKQSMSFSYFSKGSDAEKWDLNQKIAELQS